MHKRVIAVLALLTGPAIAQELQHLTVATANGKRPVSVTAVRVIRQESYPSVVLMSGQVEIRTPVCFPGGANGSEVCDGEMVVRADEATLNEATGEIEANGHVRVTPRVKK